MPPEHPRTPGMPKSGNLIPIDVRSGRNRPHSDSRLRNDLAVPWRDSGPGLICFTARRTKMTAPEETPPNTPQKVSELLESVDLQKAAENEDFKHFLDH